MIVIVYEHPSAEVRGKTRRYLYEIHPNIFIGHVSANVRDALWKELQAADTSAIMMYDTRNEQGFAVQATNKEIEGKFMDYLGLSFPVKHKTKLILTDVLAKPQKTLLQHSLESGIMAEMIMREGFAKNAMLHIADIIDQDVEMLIESVAFLVAVHDAGKCHPDFQTKMAAHNEQLYGAMTTLGLLNAKCPDGMRHERETSYALSKHGEALGLSKAQLERFEEYAAICTYHHQGKNVDFTARQPCINPEVWYALQEELFTEIEKRWKFHPELLEIEGGICGLAYLILSIMTNADWMVSSEKWENTLRGAPATIEQRARTFLKENKLLHEPISQYISDFDFLHIFGFQPNELQKAAISLAANGFDLMIIEGSCGIGKTAAGLAAALSAGGNQTGIYFAMPTKSTVRGIIESVRTILRRAGIPYEVPEFDSSAILSDDDRDKIDPELFSSAARLNMLYPCAVGTVDQLQKVVGMYKYGCLGLLGLMDKVVVIDEVHAYDTFMLLQIEMLIKWCCFMGVPVILQTATLPTKTKERLLKAAGARKCECETGYPMITTCRHRTVTQLHSAAIGKQYVIATEKTKDLLSAMYEKAISAQDGCTLIITDTVSHAIELYKKLAQKLPAEQLMLYHSRDTVDAKTAKSEQLVKFFGKDRSNRPQKAIVIATSIVEQSLDIDMDHLITALCPIDLLLQRIGRKNRHVWPANPSDVLVLVPENMEDIKIYKTPLLELTAQCLGDKCNFNTIDDARNLIDSVYRAYDSKNEDYVREMQSSACIIDNPMCDTPNNVDGQGVAYARMNQKDATTRYSAYPTVQIAIVHPKMLQNLTFETERDILKRYTVSVPEYQVQHFTNYTEIDAGLLANIRIYTTETGVVIAGEHTMQITELGCEIQ